MSHKFGFPAMTNRALGNKSSTPNVPSSQGGKFLVRVIDIILDENHPKYNQSAGLNQIGQITGESVSPDNTVKPKVYIASPASSNLKNLPLVNEYVYVYKIVGPNSKGGQWVYDPPLSLYRGLSPNSNPFPSPTYNSNPPSQNVNYSQIEAGAVNITDNQPQEINLNSIDNPSQATFVEKGNIHPLMPFAGDIIYEGRFSNSLRFGNTAKSKSQYANNWSSAGNNGDPITILRNGQDPNSSDYEQLNSDDDYKYKAIQLMGSNQNKLKIAIAKRIYETYRDHPAVKYFEETFGRKFILPEISTIPETYRANMTLLDVVYEDPNQLRFQDLPEGQSFNLARHKRNKKMQDDEEELIIPDEFE